MTGRPEHTPIDRDTVRRRKTIQERAYGLRLFQVEEFIDIKAHDPIEIVRVVFYVIRIRRVLGWLPHDVRPIQYSDILHGLERI